MKKTILFVCTGNTCRSPMAEALLKEMVAGNKDDFEIISAGTSAGEGDPAAGEAIRALEEAGIILSGHRSQRITPELLEKSDLIITMTRGHKEKLLELMPQAGEKIFSLKEYSGAIRGDGETKRILELDREEANLRREFKARKGQEEKRLLARREQLRRDLREVENQLFRLQKEKDEMLKNVRLERDELLQGKVKNLDIMDPFGGSLEIYQKTRDEIWRELENLLKGLQEEGKINSEG